MTTNMEYKFNNNIVFLYIKHQKDIDAEINIKRVGASTLAGEVVRAASIA